MKILVVGGAGYVGGGIVDTLSKENEITVYDSLIYESAYRKDVNFIYGDIRDYKKINSILNNFDAVVWLAALVGDGACSINPTLTHEINSETVKNLVKNFNGKIIFLSTCSVYGAQEGVLDENSEVNPLSEYASSKLIAEKYLEESDAIIFRLGTFLPIPGINPLALQQFFEQQSSGILGIFDTFSGGALGRMGIFALGVMPYISSSIIMTLMQSAIPFLKSLKTGLIIRVFKILLLMTSKYSLLARLTSKSLSNNNVFNFSVILFLQKSYKFLVAPIFRGVPISSL